MHRGAVVMLRVRSVKIRRGAVVVAILEERSKMLDERERATRRLEQPRRRSAPGTVVYYYIGERVQPILSVSPSSFSLSPI